MPRLSTGCYETVPFLVPVPFLRPGLISRDCTIILPVLCVDNSLKGYKPHAKDSGKRVHVGDEEKEVAHSYLGVDLSKYSYTLGQICIV